jgi:hypothetical protein
VEKNYKELQKLIKENIVQNIKAQRMKEWGHLNRLEEANLQLVTKITVWNPIGLRAKGRQRIDGETK